jgi:hypothetical protein
MIKFNFIEIGKIIGGFNKNFVLYYRTFEHLLLPFI